MWREEAGLLEMLLSYMWEYKAFGDWSSWRAELEDILSCHEALRRQRIESAVRQEGGGMESEVECKEEEAEEVIGHGIDLEGRGSARRATVDDVRVQSCFRAVEDEENCKWENEGFAVKEEEAIGEPSCAMEGRSLGVGIAGDAVSRYLMPVKAEGEECYERDCEPSSSPNVTASVLNYRPCDRAENLVLHDSSVEEEETRTLIKRISKQTASFNRKNTGIDGSCDQTLLTAAESILEKPLCSGEPSLLETGANEPIEKATRTQKCSMLQKRAIAEDIHSKNAFSCDFCPKAFAFLFKKIEHERIHTGEKPYSCSVCKKTFSQKQNKIRHERIHTGEKPYSCRYCKRKFGEKHCKMVHERIHTGEKPYSCNFCPKMFSHLSGKKTHERIHIGEKHGCSFCPKMFTTKTDKKRHERIHTGECPYVCRFCSKAFSRLEARKDHERSHR